MAKEAESLYCFAREAGFLFAENRLSQLVGLPAQEGSEHRVYRVRENREARVIKITHPDRYPGKFGRWEHTPFLYLERWALLNHLVPAVEARLEDCIRTADGSFSVIVSMAYFHGTHPGADETDAFIHELGFERYMDESSTLDYISADGRLILRDCHPLNWMKCNGLLVPIDIIPELARW